MAKTYDPKNVRLTINGRELSGLSGPVVLTPSQARDASATGTFTAEGSLSFTLLLHPRCKFGRGGRRNRKARRAAGRPS